MMIIWCDFQGLSGMTTGWRRIEKMENWGDVIYGWSLRIIGQYCTSSYFAFVVLPLWEIGAKKNIEKYYVN